MSSSRFGNEFIVYRYTDVTTGDVVYIGKTNCSLKARVDAHRREEAFGAYHCSISYVVLANQVETDSVEKVLINYYKPVLNTKDKVPAVTDGLFLPDLNWHSYDEYLAALGNYERTAWLKEQAMKQTVLLDAVFAGMHQVRLPYVPPVLPNGMMKEHVYKDKDEYVIEIEESAVDIVLDHYYEMLLNIWDAYTETVSWNDKLQKELDYLLMGMDFCKLLDDFIWNGYETEQSLFLCDLHIPAKYYRWIPYFIDYFKLDVRQTYFDDFVCEFGTDHADKMPGFKESICRKIAYFYMAHDAIATGKELVLNGYGVEMGE